MKAIQTMGAIYQNSSANYSKDEQTAVAEVANRLEEVARKDPAKFESYTKMKFTIHSYNELVAPEMVERLRKLGVQVKWVPFGT